MCGRPLFLGEMSIVKPPAHPARGTRRLLAVLLLATIAAHQGCSSSSDTRNFAKVSGKVMYHGQYLKSGRVSFVPAESSAGSPASGEIGPDGSYSMMTTTPG